MAEEPADMTLELLRQIRGELVAFRESMDAQLMLVDRRMDGLESDMLEVKRTLRGMAYMMATFTGRLEDVETRVERLGAP